MRVSKFGISFSRDFLSGSMLNFMFTPKIGKGNFTTGGGFKKVIFIRGEDSQFDFRICFKGVGIFNHQLSDRFSRPLGANSKLGMSQYLPASKVSWQNL